MRTTFLFLSLLLYTNVYGNIVIKSNELCYVQDTNTEEQRDLDLIGSLPSPATRTLAQPISLSQGSHYLQANFRNSLGWIRISIYSDLGNLEYQKEVNTANETNLYIELSRLDKGDYTIEFLNLENQSLIGHFDL